MTTPMFAQYQSLKQAHPDAILFFRMGDFYETFYEDAEISARVLELTLTARNKQAPDPIPMAGVPHHAATGYIQRLVDQGYRVAIAEQVEDPAQAKGLVKREVVRVVTPGVVLDPTALQAKEANYLAAVSFFRGRGWGIGLLDVTTGDFRLTSVESASDVVAALHRVEPKEVLLAPKAEACPEIAEACERLGATLSEVDKEAWRYDVASEELLQLFEVHTLDGFGVQDKEPGIIAAGAVARYARERLGQALDNVYRLTTWRTGRFMVIDESTRRNLELVRTLIGGHRKGSLLGLLDRTSTAMGSRKIKEWLNFPLLDRAEIETRQDAVAALVEAPEVLTSLRKALREVADVERIAARVCQGTAHARDLSALRRSLLALPDAIAEAKTLPALTPVVPTDLLTELGQTLDAWLVDDPPLSLTEGGLLRRGQHEELDEVMELALEGRSIISKMEADERAATGIGSLKIRHNKVFGYFLEVTRAHIHKVPEHYLRKQTLSNAERYITPELKELEEKVLGADERRKRLEYALFTELREEVQAEGERLSSLARGLAGLDVFCALADCAVRYDWTRPVVDESTDLELEAARHPVVEAALQGESFVPNDLRLESSLRRMVVLTGPNMSGKSTLMRQVALMVLLAQVGSFVPATRARIGLTDRIFTRVGAADDLSRGQSTFMVEMAETSSILHHATDRSLVILDEIGRGTSTYDGLSIAWAVAEDLVDRIACRALFATHYHELCELAETRHAVVNQSIAVSGSGDRIVFLRTLKEGGANRSYGIQCARLAGLPQPVVRRAKQLLTHFEKHAPRNEKDQLSLFGQSSAALPESVAEEPEAAPDLLRELLQTLDPDEMSPREALQALYRLREAL